MCVCVCVYVFVSLWCECMHVLLHETFVFMYCMYFVWFVLRQAYMFSRPFLAVSIICLFMLFEIHLKF